MPLDITIKKVKKMNLSVYNTPVQMSKQNQLINLFAVPPLFKLSLDYPHYSIVQPLPPTVYARPSFNHTTKRT